MSIVVTDVVEVSERCSVVRIRNGSTLVWAAECHVCFEDETFFDGDATNPQAAATSWGEDHECPIAVQVDE